MKALTCLIALSVSALAMCGEVVMSIKTDIGVSGKATMTNKIQPDGRKYVRLSMLLKQADGKSVSVMQESYYEKDGTPIRILQVTNMADSGTRQSVTVTFDSKGAHVSADAGGKTLKNTFALPSGSIKCFTEFWFIRDKPNPGDIGTIQRFDISNQRWLTLKFQYHGKREVEIDGKKVSAHLVTFGDSRAYLDDAGDPWLVQGPDMTMTRVSQ